MRKTKRTTADTYIVILGQHGEHVRPNFVGCISIEGYLIGAWKWYFSLVWDPLGQT